MGDEPDATANERRRLRPELGVLYEMIDEIEVAMMTTRREDGHLVPMMAHPEACDRCRSVVLSRRRGQASWQTSSAIPTSTLRT